MNDFEKYTLYAMIFGLCVMYWVFAYYDRKWTKTFRAQQDRELGKMLLEAFDEARREKREEENENI